MVDFRNSYRLRLLPLFVCAFALIGCDDDEKSKAIEDAERSRRSLNAAEAKLTRAQKEIADLEEQLQAVAERRDTLEAQVKRLLEDQGRAVGTAREAQEGVRSLTARSTAQTESLATLQGQISELTSITQSQEKTIQEQEATIVELLKTIEIQQQSLDEQYGGRQGQEDVNESRPD